MDVSHILDGVVGLKAQKREIINVLSWYLDSEKYKKLGLSIPCGIILFGDPGNGKSLIIRLIKENCNIPCFYYAELDSNIPRQINNLFSEAKKQPKSIVILDELDLLINKDSRVTRCLQENLDGVQNQENKPLVLCACNDLDEIPDPLLRQGRLGKQINIDNPSSSDIQDFLSCILKGFNINPERFISSNELIRTLRGLSYVTIQATINDALLRHNADTLTADDIMKSFFYLDTYMPIDDEENISYLHCIHEAGHCVMSLKYPDIPVGNLKVGNGRSYYSNAINSKTSFAQSFDFLIATINIGLAGNIAERLFFKRISCGHESDLNRVTQTAKTMVISLGYKGYENALNLSNYQLLYSDEKLSKVNKIQDNIIKKCTKETRRYLKKHTAEIKCLADELFKKKYLTPNEIMTIVRSSTKHPSCKGY